jgi:hypothetical protein
LLALREELYELPGVERAIVDAIARGEALDAHAVRFLLWQYQAHERVDLGEIAGLALAQAIEAGASSSSVLDDAAWLGLFVEASAYSDDARLGEAIDRLAGAMRDRWNASGVEESAAAIGACLDAARLDRFRPLAADAFDALEQLVARAYRPGAGVGAFADQVRTAFTLLTAFELSDRLPYSMLAEELMRTPHDDPESFAAACEGARVLCRLAVLHDDEEYRKAAVIAPDADYRRDARGLLARHAAEAQQRGAAGAIYGVALLELESASQKELP